MDDLLRVEVQDLNEGVLITVVGEVDAASVGALEAPLDGAGLERDILVDMAGVRFMDSSGLKVILEQRMRMADRGGSIHVRNPSPAVQLLLDTTNLDHVLYESDATSAESSLESPLT